MKPLFVITGAILLIFTKVSVHAHTSPDDPGTLFNNAAKIYYKSKELQEDFRLFRNTLEEEHCCLYEYTSKKDFDQLFDRQFDQIRDSMSLREFFTLLTPVVSWVGCGHTNVWMPMSFWEQNRENMFPLRFRMIEGMAVVTGSYREGQQVPAGSVILEINGRPFIEVFDELVGNWPGDAMNIYGRRRSVEKRFPMAYARQYGFPDKWTLLYALPGRKSSLLATLVPALNKEVREVVFNLFRDPELSLQIDQERDLAILTVNSFVYYDRVDFFKHFMDSCFKKIHNQGTGNLVLDLRGNSGGDPFCAAPLFSYLENSPAPYFAEPYGRYFELAKPIPRAKYHFEGNLYTLMDGSCFSTNAHFCALLKYHDIGTIVGTPSGGTFTCNAGKNTNITLEHTRIMVYFGRSSYRVAVEGMDPSKAIEPDMLIKETYRQFLQGRDPYMDVVRELIRTGS